MPGPVDVDPKTADRVADAAPDPEGTVVGIGGHSHRVVDDTAGVRVPNPGTVTGADPGPRTTTMTPEVEGGDVDVTLHERDE